MVARMLEVKMRSPEVAHHGQIFMEKKNFSYEIICNKNMLLYFMYRLHSRWISVDG